MSSRWLPIVAPLAVGILLLLIWQALVTINDVPVYIVPSPGKILATLIADRALLAGSDRKSVV